MSKINPKIIDQIFEGVDIPDNDQMRRQVSHQKKVDAGLKNWQNAEYRKKVVSILQEQNTKRAKDPKWRKQNAEKWRKVKADPEIQKKRLENQKKAMSTPEYRKSKKLANQKLAKDPAWLKKVTIQAQKRSQSAEWKKNHMAVQRKKATAPEYEGFRNRMKQIAKEKGNACRVKAPGKNWIKFDTFGEAARYFDWPNLSSAPKGCFPEDGSIKQWKARSRKGYQTQRIID